MRPLFAVVLAAGQGTRMRSARPKPLHMLCGRPAGALRARRPGRQRRPSGRWWSWATAPTWSPRSCRRTPGRCRSSSSSSACSAAPATPSRSASPACPTTTSTTPTTATSWSSPATRRCCGPTRSPPSSSEHRAVRRGVHAAHRPHGRPHRLRPGRARQGRSGAPHRRAARRRRRPSGRSTRSTRRSTCFRRGLLAPALRRITPENAQGELYLTDVVEVLAEAGHPVVVARRRRRRSRPRASTTGPSWPRPRPSCGAARTTAGCARASRMVDPDRHLRRHHRRRSPPTSRCSRARCSRAPTVVGAGTEIGPAHPPGRLPGRRAGHGRTRPWPRWPRSATMPSSAPSPCSSPAPGSVQGAQNGPVLHWRPPA